MNKKLTLIAGPDPMENEEMVLEVAAKLKEITDRLGINFIFKGSFDKANRSSINSKRGLGMEEGLRLLQKVKDIHGIQVTTDIHESYQAEIVAKVVDIIQIPAFLFRQTDLLVAAAQTGKTVNVKKGQFAAPWDMKNAITKLEEAGAKDVWLTERGSTFGYNRLVVDYTGMLYMQTLKHPVVFDATHSVQQPGGLGETTGGNREYVPSLAKAAVAMGIDHLFMEIHPDPDNAWADGPNQVRLEDADKILTELVEIYNLVNKA
ncbi:3-deoxy-8-phosphooctulonate synthase [Lactococcus muris]|uniref:2-dehydro-3-deoxyphosphooctonate aldolase n=1 Tax=Lactococcus muris TaxID=2941330 RepID=A0ABV4DB20_9LACT